ncbi:MAG: energy transducer TonB [Cyclobacteriaceae bacterium]|nr:energy transducer TonB [Cyclobacteriaceae bacterium]
MSKIKNINLEFSCPESRNTLKQTVEVYSCDKCSKEVIDFTNKSDKEFQRIISESIEPVCGIFKRSQLSQKFVKYAAATFIATATSLSLKGQNIIVKDSIADACLHLEEEHEEDGEFFGTIIETQAEPIGGYPKFFEAISQTIKYPSELTEKGKVFIEFTVDTLGRIGEFKIVRSYNKLADQVALDAIKNLNFTFNPGKQRGKTVKTRLVIPIAFNPKDEE